MRFEIVRWNESQARYEGVTIQGDVWFFDMSSGRWIKFGDFLHDVFSQDVEELVERPI